MKKYYIEHKVLTLSHCAVMDNKESPASFKVESIEFCHWDFNYRDGWKSDAWIASSSIEAENSSDAINVFKKRLSRLIPRISLICQSYIEFTQEPFFIHDKNKDIAYFHYIEDVDSVGLMFMEKEKEALDELLNNDYIPEEFYYYWNDAVNATGYSSKLLLMFSAIESIVKKNGQKDWVLINNILGENLVKEFFGTKDHPNSGLRHRLVHGEYFGIQDNGKDYLETIHKKIITYFNTMVFSKPLIQEDVVRPQRHFFGNKQESRSFIKTKDGSNTFSLKDLLNDFNDNGFRNPNRYEYVHDNQLTKNY